MNASGAFAQLVQHEIRAEYGAGVLDLAAAVDRERNNPLQLYRLASYCRAHGRVDLWHGAVELALGLPHLTAEQIYNRGLVKLTLGDWTGWIDFEARLFDQEHQSKYAPVLRWQHRAWDGCEDLKDQILLIYLEKGCGDGIQMLRFIPSIVAKSGRVIVAVRPELAQFVKTNVDSHVVLTLRGFDLPRKFDRYIWSMSLPSLATGLPPFTPLSSATPSLPGGAGSARPRIGVCWAGDPQLWRDQERSMQISALAPLLALRDFDFVSLQVGSRESDADVHTELHRPIPALRTFADTANLIARLDCVVTVDTAVCHLAGSLGVPTLVLLPYASEWRWGLSSTTPWYPSMELIRQQQPGNWSGAVSQVLRRIEELLHGRLTSGTCAVSGRR